MIGFGHTSWEEGIRIGEERSAQTIAEKDAVIAEKDSVIVRLQREKDTADTALAEKDNTIAQLQRQLALLTKLAAPNN